MERAREAEFGLSTLEDAAQYLEGLIDRERRTDYVYRRLDLQPIRSLLDSLGSPEESLSIIHVAGSKGKGSTCLFAEQLLIGLGERVGTFTSPHLESWIERFRVDGQPIEAPTLVRAVSRLQPLVEKLRVGPDATRPSFFDATTAVALLVFAEAGVDRVLLEVGLGGRLDSTNVVMPEVTCITSIELEHTDKLGETEAEIAAEKAGILKPGIPVVVGPLRPDALATVREVAGRVGAPRVEWGEVFEVSSDPKPGESGWSFREAEGFQVSADLGVAGGPARVNAGLALASVRALKAYDDGAVAAAVRDTFPAVRLPARLEILAGDPDVIVDAAHTVESARALARALEVLAPDGFDLLLSVSADKHVDALLDCLLGRAGRVWVTQAEPTRSLTSTALARRVEASARAGQHGVELRAIADPEEAARVARASLPAGSRLCATGSVYLAGIARRVLGGEAPGSGASGKDG